MIKKQFLTKMAAFMLIGIMTITGVQGCGAASAASSTSQSKSQTTAETKVTAMEANISDTDAKDTWDEAASTKVTLDDSAITVDGEGAEADGSVLKITAAGTYIISGTLSDGQIVVETTKEDKVQLVFQNADITNKTGAPVYASQCDKLVVTLAEGTKNTLTDGGDSFAYANETDKEPNAALFCKDDLTINGSGSLTVNAGFNNGIGSKDDLTIVNGNITVNAKNHGLRGNDSVTIAGGNVQITAGSDGIQTNNTEDAEKGYIIIADGSLKITSGNDGIQADTQVTVSGGQINIIAGGGATEVAASTTADPQSPDQTGSTASTTDEASTKGIKAGGNIAVTGGVIEVSSLDDSIHANGSIATNSASYTLASSDDGMHADGSLTISGGTIHVTGSYEGIEAANIYVSDGEIDVVSSDDGFNAAGGNDQSGQAGQFGQDNFTASGDYSLNISGGSIVVKAGGDGLDSNGTINISDGKVMAFINSSPDNEAIDCDGDVTITGGEIVYSGTGTGANPGDGSTQSYIYSESAVSKGDEITLKKDGKTVISFTAELPCDMVAISTPEIKSGESYDLYKGSEKIATVTAGSGGGSMMMGGNGGQGGGPEGQGNVSPRGGMEQSEDTVQ